MLTGNRLAAWPHQGYPGYPLSMISEHIKGTDTQLHDVDQGSRPSEPHQQHIAEGGLPG
jgi:hypothetical protein